MYMNCTYIPSITLMALKTLRSLSVRPSIFDSAVTTKPHLLNLSRARVPIVSFHTTAARMSLDEWKTRAPYKVHENDPNFNVRYEGACHCGRVKYQLSREKPLDAKYCHCTTCQKLHGEFLRSIRECLKVNTADCLQAHRSSGLPSSTKTTSTSLMVIMISDGTTAPKRQRNINYRVKSAALIAVPRSWTKAGT